LHRKPIASRCFTIHGAYAASAVRVSTTLLVLADSSSYQITSIDGKGLGFIATRRILAGEKILEERPILMGKMTELKQRFGIILAQFSSTKRQQIRALYNAFPEDNDEVGILVTNSYSLGPQGGLSGLFQNLSRLNHSCRPNSERCWDHDQEVETLYALRCIETGEELTVSYFGNAEMTRAERQCVLRTSWRFECKCECCSLTGVTLEASDNRRAFLKKVEELVPYITPHQSLDSVKKALMFLDEEGLGGSPRAYICNTAYELALSTRNVEEAKSFANEGYTQYSLATGSTSQWTNQMRVRTDNPTVHIMWNPLRSTVWFFICFILIQIAILSRF
jgi:SET domain